MPIEHLTLIGAGGHAKVVLDALRVAAVAAKEVRLVDENPSRVGALLWDVPIGLFEAAGIAGHAFHVCIGANAARARIFTLARKGGARPHSVVHPHGSQARGASWGEGSLLAAGARLGPDVRIGEGCIINHNAVVDHDSVLGDFCHIAPGATLAGNVRLGHGVLVGAGANILPGVRIGDGTTIGAGAVVLKDVPSHCLYVGVPARKIEK